MKHGPPQRFIAHSVRNFLKNSEVKQEFTHIATPEENSYIEAFYSILEHGVIERNEFVSFYESDRWSRERNVEALFFPLKYCRLQRSIGFITARAFRFEGPCGTECPR